MALFCSFRIQFCRHCAADYYNNKLRDRPLVLWFLLIFANCKFHMNCSQLARVGFHVVKLSGWHFIADALLDNWVLWCAVYLQEILELGCDLCCNLFTVKKTQTKTSYCTSCTLKKAITGASCSFSLQRCCLSWSLHCWLWIGKNMLKKLSYVVYLAHTSWNFLWSACVLMNTVGLFTWPPRSLKIKNLLSIYGANNLKYC